MLTCHEKNSMCDLLWATWVTYIGDHIVGHKLGHNVYSVVQNKKVFLPSKQKTTRMVRKIYRNTKFLS